MSYDKAVEEFQAASSLLKNINRELVEHNEGMRKANEQAKAALYIVDGALRIARLSEIVRTQWIPLVRGLSGSLEDHGAAFGNRARTAIGEWMEIVGDANRHQLQEIIDKMMELRTSIHNARSGHTTVRNAFTKKLPSQVAGPVEQRQMDRLVNAVDVMDRQMVELDSFAFRLLQEAQRRV